MKKNIQYDMHNPHPLSMMKTELVWEGKYDEFGNRREVDIATLAMPMQKIETVDEPRSQANAMGTPDLFEEWAESKRIDDFRNHLIWGDNKLVMGSLLKDFKGKIDLIYIDPPFDVGADFTMKLPIGDSKETIQKDQSTLEMVAYRDMWGRGTDSYLHMIYDRLVLMKELLSKKGSIYVHCDWRVNSFLRIILDEIFGKEMLKRELIWNRGNPSGGKAGANNYIHAHDTILFFTKTTSPKFNKQYVPYTKEYIKERFIHNDKEKGAYRLQGSAPNVRKQYLSDSKGKAVTSVWTIPDINVMAIERIDYPTQKPEALLERIIKASSNEGDLVADFFCGSGTTGAVAEKLGRRWIMSDLGRFSIHTVRKRIIELQRKLYDEDRLRTSQSCIRFFQSRNFTNPSIAFIAWKKSRWILSCCRHRFNFYKK